MPTLIEKLSSRVGGQAFLPTGISDKRWEEKRCPPYQTTTGTPRFPDRTFRGEFYAGWQLTL